MRKLLAMLLALVMVLGLLPMLASAEASGTVRILAAVTGGKDADEMELWAKALSEATGLTIEVERPASDYDTILMQKLSAGESYDLIYVGASQYANLVEQGAHRKFLLAERFAAYERYFLHLVGRDGAHFDEFLLGLGYLPDRNFSFVFEFLS